MFIRVYSSSRYKFVITGQPHTEPGGIPIEDKMIDAGAVFRVLADGLPNETFHELARLMTITNNYLAANQPEDLLRHVKTYNADRDKRLV